MKKLISILITLAALAGVCMGQANFSATGTNAMLSTHFDYGTTPYTQLDARLSTSTNPVGGNGLTSPAMVVAMHVGGKDLAINPNFGVVGFGSFQFGTGSLLGGDLSSTAVFGVDQSYVTMTSNGGCGQFRSNGTCKAYTPQSDTEFVGVFTGFITWTTDASGVHSVWGIVRGKVNGGATRNCSFKATGIGPFLNGHTAATTVSVQPIE